MFKKLITYLKILAVLTALMVCIPIFAPGVFPTATDLYNFFYYAFIVVIILAFPVWGLCEMFRKMKSSEKNSYINAYLVIVAVLNSIFVLLLLFPAGPILVELLSLGPFFLTMLIVAFIISLILAIPIWLLWLIASEVDPASAKNRNKNGAKNGAKKKPNRQPNNE